jgi:hypothetical protein
MKIVQSFWSKPMLDKNDEFIANHNYGFWLSKEMFYYTYVLSSLLINKSYKRQSVLVTDKFGKDLLLDKLGLRYNEVIIKLDSLNAYPKQFWALGKIYTYSLLNSPFIHIDFDFLLAKRFDTNFTRGQVVTYMDESDDRRQRAYRECVNQYFSKYKLPLSIQPYFKNYQYAGYNAGVCGGNNKEIFKELWNISKEIIENNITLIEKDIYKNSSSFSMTNVILEQYILACLAHKDKIPVTCLQNNENSLPDEDLSFWFKDGNYAKYKAIYFPDQHIHMLGEHKSNVDNAILIRDTLNKVSPIHLNLIDDLIKNNSI